jgi:hypothetical protein
LFKHETDEDTEREIILENIGEINGTTRPAPAIRSEWHGFASDTSSNSSRCPIRIAIHAAASARAPVVRRRESDRARRTSGVRSTTTVTRST